MKRFVATVFVIGAVFLFSAPHGALAQTSSLAPFYIHLNPNYPQPYSSVVLTLSGNAISINNSTFSVLVNGKKVGTSTGRQPVSFETGASGKSMYVVVRTNFNGKVYTRTVTLHPASVALVVEPLSTAPMWYPGTPTIPSFGKVRLVAIPNMQINGKPLSPSTLSYVWKIGNETLQASGVGKDSAVINAPLPYRENSVSVTVQDPKNTQTAQRALTLVSGTPVVHIYENNPLTGTDYGHALSSNFGATIGSSESTFVAVPYGFSLTGATPIVTWFLNGAKVQTGPMLTVRPKGAGGGSATISALVEKDSAYESEKAQIPLQFGSHTGGFGLFGL
ncbi:MAG TPA: hypothetical protein ENI56_00385 [Candidatus Kaiserbacteria bacterium]|nr:hypothetical protein [Candidatus Kaiserbacteria bacterium]